MKTYETITFNMKSKNNEDREVRITYDSIETFLYVYNKMLENRI